MKYIVIETKSGKLRGFEKDNVRTWKGIPYALPPIGKLRYKAPKPVEPWQGIKDALEFGNVCFQRGRFPIVYNNINESEDCLYLNITSSTSLVEKKPVVVWIHGGAFLNGAGSLPAYDGEKFVVNGDIVFVSINYRLGPLGFLKLSSFGHGFEDNLGLLDQVAALRWVKENIEFFGGNPENITVMGESAGAISIAYLLATTDINKLFSKAILQSGILEERLTESEAFDITVNLLKKLNINEDNIEKLETIPVENIIQAADEIGKELQEGIDRHIFYPFTNSKLRKEPKKAIEEGMAKGIPILIGTNRDEGWLFTKDKAQAERITESFWKDSAQLAKSQSKFAPVFKYRFDYTVTDHYFASKAVHGLEIPFVFNNLKVFQIESEKNRLLADKIQKLWISFIRYGTPQIEGVKWPEYEASNYLTAIFDNEIKVLSISEPYASSNK
ncbi:carboxylesterase/lipase family protein [Clostridium manihotivorum]|nr:carboxylesterase/lipase family protein [Clostridium manihotivorum]